MLDLETCHAIRNRRTYALLIVLTIPIGLATRTHPHLFPTVVARYGGDVLYATLVFWLWAWCFPRRSTWTVAVIAAGSCYLIEVSQLYHAPWLDALRQTLFGRLVLGQGFLWSDWACYTVGVLLGVAIEVWGNLRPLTHRA